MKTSAIKKILLTISLFFLVALIKVNAAPDPLNPAPGGAVYTFGGNPSSYRNVSCSVNSSTKDGASTPNLINLAGQGSSAVTISWNVATVTTSVGSYSATLSCTYDYYNYDTNRYGTIGWVTGLSSGEFEISYRVTDDTVTQKTRHVSMSKYYEYQRKSMAIGYADLANWSGTPVANSGAFTFQGCSEGSTECYVVANKDFNSNEEKIRATGTIYYTNKSGSLVTVNLDVEIDNTRKIYIQGPGEYGSCDMSKFKKEDTYGVVDLYSYKIIGNEAIPLPNCNANRSHYSFNGWTYSSNRGWGPSSVDSCSNEYFNSYSDFQVNAGKNTNYTIPGNLTGADAFMYACYKAESGVTVLTGGIKLDWAGSEELFDKSYFYPTTTGVALPNFPKSNGLIEYDKWIKYDDPSVTKTPGQMAYPGETYTLGVKQIKDETTERVFDDDTETIDFDKWFTVFDGDNWVYDSEGYNPGDYGEDWSDGTGEAGKATAGVTCEHFTINPLTDFKQVMNNIYIPGSDRTTASIRMYQAICKDPESSYYNDMFFALCLDPTQNSPSSGATYVNAGAPTKPLANFAKVAAKNASNQAIAVIAGEDSDVGYALNIGARFITQSSGYYTEGGPYGSHDDVYAVVRNASNGMISQPTDFTANPTWSYVNGNQYITGEKFSYASDSLKNLVTKYIYDSEHLPGYVNESSSYSTEIDESVPNQVTFKISITNIPDGSINILSANLLKLPAGYSWTIHFEGTDGNICDTHSGASDYRCAGIYNNPVTHPLRSAVVTIVISNQAKSAAAITQDIKMNNVKFAYRYLNQNSASSAILRPENGNTQRFLIYTFVKEEFIPLGDVNVDCDNLLQLYESGGEVPFTEAEIAKTCCSTWKNTNPEAYNLHCTLNNCFAIDYKLVCDTSGEGSAYEPSYVREAVYYGEKDHRHFNCIIDAYTPDTDLQISNTNLKRDEGGNEIQIKALTGNNYCAGTCFEDWDIYTPGFDNFTGERAVVAGSFFRIEQDIYFSTTRSCQTTFINYEQYKHDMEISSKNIVDYENKINKAAHTETSADNIACDSNATCGNTSGTGTVADDQGDIEAQSNPNKDAQPSNGKATWTVSGEPESYYMSTTHVDKVCDKGTRDKGKCYKSYDACSSGWTESGGECVKCTTGSYNSTSGKCESGTGATATSTDPSTKDYDACSSGWTKANSQCEKAAACGTASKTGGHVVPNSDYDQGICYEQYDERSCYSYTLTITGIDYMWYEDKINDGGFKDDYDKDSFLSKNLTKILYTNGTLADYGTPTITGTATNSPDDRDATREGNCTTDINVKSEDSENHTDEMKYWLLSGSNNLKSQAIDLPKSTITTNQGNITTEIETVNKRAKDMTTCQNWKMYDSKENPNGGKQQGYNADGTFKPLESDFAHLGLTLKYEIDGVDSQYDPQGYYRYEETEYQTILGEHNKLVEDTVYNFSDPNDFNSVGLSRKKLGDNECTNVTVSGITLPICKDNVTINFFEPLNKASYKVPAGRVKVNNLRNHIWDEEKADIYGGEIGDAGSFDSYDGRPTKTKVVYFCSSSSGYTWAQVNRGNEANCRKYNLSYYETSYIKQTLQNAAFYRNEGGWFINLRSDVVVHGIDSQNCESGKYSDCYKKELADAESQYTGADKKEAYFSLLNTINQNVMPVKATTRRGLYQYVYAIYNIGLDPEGKPNGRLIGGDSSGTAHPLSSTATHACFYEVLETLCHCCGQPIGTTSTEISSHVSDDDKNQVAGEHGMPTTDFSGIFLNEDGSISVYNSTVSLYNLFPNGTASANFQTNNFKLDDTIVQTDQGAQALSGIEKKGEKIYDEPAEYAYQLRPNTIAYIRSYNKNNDYVHNKLKAVAAVEMSSGNLNRDLDDSNDTCSKSYGCQRFIEWGSTFLEDKMSDFVYLTADNILTSRTGNNNICTVSAGTDPTSYMLSHTECRFLIYKASTSVGDVYLPFK